MQPLFERLAKSIADAFSRPLESLRKSSPHDRTSTDDARLRLYDWVQKRPVQFGVLAAGASAVTAVLVPTDLAFPWNVLVAAGAAALAAAAVPAFAFVGFFLTAPARQRDAARAELTKKQAARLKKRPPAPSPAKPRLDPGQITRVLAERRAERLEAEIQDELVAIIDQGRALNKNAFDEVGYGPFKHWQEKTITFLETVLGPLESQRFTESYDPAPMAFSETVEHRLKRLAALRDRPQSWKPKVESHSLRRACEARRAVSEGELIVLAGDSGGAAQVPRRLDRAEIAVELRELAAAIESTLEDSRPAEERGIEAVERRARDSAPAQPMSLIRELAETTVAAETRKVVLREHGEQLAELVDALVDLGVVARTELEDYAHPDKDGLKNLPARLRNAAGQLETFVAPSS